jgi:hypothetical protein
MNPEKEVINHFQNVTSSLNQDKILTGNGLNNICLKIILIQIFMMD